MKSSAKCFLYNRRSIVLGKTGANIVGSRGAGALKFIAEWNFNVIVLCHSVRPEDARKITDAAHSDGSKTLVLLLVSEAVREQSYDGISFDARSFVQQDCLVRSTTDLLNRQVKPI